MLLCPPRNPTSGDLKLVESRNRVVLFTMLGPQKTSPPKDGTSPNLLRTQHLLQVRSHIPGPPPQSSSSTCSLTFLLCSFPLLQSTWTFLWWLSICQSFPHLCHCWYRLFPGISHPHLSNYWEPSQSQVLLQTNFLYKVFSYPLNRIESSHILICLYFPLPPLKTHYVLPSFVLKDNHEHVVSDKSLCLVKTKNCSLEIPKKARKISSKYQRTKDA